MGLPVPATPATPIPEKLVEKGMEPGELPNGITVSTLGENFSAFGVAGVAAAETGTGATDSAATRGVAEGWQELGLG